MCKMTSVKTALPEIGICVLVFSDDYLFASIGEDGQWYVWGSKEWLAEWEVKCWSYLPNPVEG